MNITVRFACTHQANVDPNVSESPQCAECGETRISHVKAPAPVFRGFVTGPCAAKKDP